MDEKRTDLKAALRELATEESGDAGPHVGSKRLIAYREGSLPPAESEEIQEHLSLCSRCTDLLLELRDFEAASARGEAGPESLRQEAWESLARRLPSKTATVRPFTPHEAPRQRRLSRFLLSAAAALMLAVLGLALWAMVTAQQERQRLQERDATITALRGTLADAERQLDAARSRIQDLERNTVDPVQPAGRLQELEARVAELTAALEELRRAPQTREQTVVASREIEVSVSPLFAVRGQESRNSNLLQGKGTINPIRIAPQAERFTVTLNLADHPVYNEYRIELSDREGAILWSARRPGKSLLGDTGIKVSVNGLPPGIYRLRIEGMQAERSEVLGEYILKVEQH